MTVLKLQMNLITLYLKNIFGMHSYHQNEELAKNFVICADNRPARQVPALRQNYVPECILTGMYSGNLIRTCNYS